MKRNQHDFHDNNNDDSVEYSDQSGKIKVIK